MFQNQLAINFASDLVFIINASLLSGLYYKFTLPPRAFILQELENILFQYAAIFACPRDLVQIDLLGQTRHTHKNMYCKQGSHNGLGYIPAK